MLIGNTNKIIQQCLIVIPQRLEMNPQNAIKL